MSYTVGVVGQNFGGSVVVGNMGMANSVVSNGSNTSVMRVNGCVFINGQLLPNAKSVAIVDGDVYVDDCRLQRSCNCPLELDRNDTIEQRRRSAQTRQQGTDDRVALTVRIKGNVRDTLELIGCETATVRGDVHGNIRGVGNGPLTTGNVRGSVSSTSGGVHVNGNVGAGVANTSGGVTVEGDIVGNVATTSGSVRSYGRSRHRRRDEDDDDDEPVQRPAKRRRRHD